MNKKLDLAEIFYSLQGESSFAGFPCIFIRLAGCNLRCNYCDTTFAFETKFSLSVDEIIEKIEEYLPVNLVEITGGEPLLQDEVYKLFQALHKKKFTLLLETNGSLSLEKVPDYVIKIVDVKCPESGEEGSFLMENFRFIAPEKDEIKFVITNKWDYEWAKKLIFRFKIFEYRIIFSPVAEILEPHFLADWIIADKLPVRFQIQLHKYFWKDN